jgi:hypothetical protein
MDREAGGLPSAEVLTGLRSRKDFLKMMGAAGIGTAVGANLFLREAFALDPTGPTDPSFSFSVTANYSAFDVLSDNFVEHRDGFNKNQSLYTVLKPGPEFTRAGVSISKGSLRAIGDAPFFTLLRSGKSPVAPYAAVIVDVAK